MPRCTREQAYSALFDLVKTIPPPAGYPWAQIVRGLKQWDQVPTGSQPAMFFEQTYEVAIGREVQGITKWRWHSALLVYFRIDTLGNVADWQYRNALVDNIETTIRGRRGERQTLGGLIEDCYIEGTMGPLELEDNQALIITPLIMLTGI